MGNAKEFNHNVQTFFDYCQKGNLEKVNNWLQNKTKKSKLPLNFFRPTMPCSGWLTCFREPSTSYTALHQASLHGHFDVVRILVDQDHDLIFAQDKRGCLPVHLAVWNGHTDIVEHFLHVESCFVNAVNNAKECPLHLAALHGHGKIVNLLLQYNANPRLRNARFETPLDIAARTGATNICKILLINCPELALESAAKSTTILPETRLLSAKAIYALHLAARYGNTDCVSTLCESGFDVNYVTEDGTALHVAATFGQVESVRLLLLHGANLSICDSDGKTALDRLKQLEKHKSSDLTHVKQSTPSWKECRLLLEDHLNLNNKNIKCRKSVAEKAPTISLNDNEHCVNNNVVWRVVPNNVLRHADQISQHSSFRSSHSNSSSSRRAGSDGYWNGNIKGCLKSGTVNVRPAFPKTSANGHINWFDMSSIGLKTPPNQNLQQRCNNQYTTQAQSIYSNITLQCAPSHKNVSGNIKLNDNMASINNKQWKHNCYLNGSYCKNEKFYRPSHRQHPATIGVGESQCRTVIINKNLDETSSMPVNRTPSTRPSILEVFSQQNQNNCKALSSENTSAFSTLERVENYDDIDTSAPIALPEELEGSMCASNISLSPDRFPINNLFFNCDKSNINNCKFNEFSSNLTLSSNLQPQFFDQSSLTTKISQDSLNQNKIAKTDLSNSVQNLKYDVSSLQIDSLSENSNSAVSLRSSLRENSPLLITISSESVKLKSCKDNCDFRNLIINGKIVDSDASQQNRSISPQLSLAQQSVDIQFNIDDNLMSDANRNDENASPLMRKNHSVEWRKIDEILTSIQRGSFFADQCDVVGQLDVFKPKSQLLPPLTLELAKPNVEYAILAQNTISRKCFNSLMTLWLHNTVNFAYELATQIASVLELNGFDNILFLKGTLNEIFLTEMEISKSAQNQLLSFLNVKMNETNRGVDEFEYLSDWLDSLCLIDYLGSFANANLTYTPDIIAARLTRSDLEKMGIALLGHVSRIMRSLELATIKSNVLNQTQCKNIKVSLLDLLAGYVPPPPPLLSNDNIAKNELSDQKQLLLDECISFSAHYLGSVEISNVEGAEDCRRAMTTSKKRIKQVNKVPQVILEISVGGVNVLDATTNKLIVQHEINRIQVICQDELDLNCFAYIFQDGEKNFCHVYCVLTAGVAKDVILTLGEAFNLAFSLLNENGTPKCFQ